MPARESGPTAERWRSTTSRLLRRMSLCPARCGITDSLDTRDVTGYMFCIESKHTGARLPQSSLVNGRVRRGSGRRGMRLRRSAATIMPILEHQPISARRPHRSGRSRTIGLFSLDPTTYGKTSALLGIHRATQGFGLLREHRQRAGLGSRLDADRDGATPRPRGRRDPRGRSTARGDRHARRAVGRRSRRGGGGGAAGATLGRGHRPLLGRGRGDASPARARSSHGLPHRRAGGPPGSRPSSRRVAGHAAGGRRGHPDSDGRRLERRGGLRARTPPGACAETSRRSSWPTTRWPWA